MARNTQTKSGKTCHDAGMIEQSEVDVGSSTVSSGFGGFGTVASPCPRCGRDLKSAPLRQVDWLPHPFRTCGGCGLGIAFRRNPGENLRQRLRIPIAIGRLILIPTILMAIGFTTSVVGFELAIPSPYITISINLGVTTICVAVGILLLVSMAPHLGGTACLLTWILTIALTGSMVVSYVGITRYSGGFPENVLLSVWLQLGSITLLGILLCHPFAFARDLVLKLWNRNRTDRGPQ